MVEDTRRRESKARIDREQTGLGGHRRARAHWVRRARNEWRGRDETAEEQTKRTGRTQADGADGDGAGE